MMNKRRFLIGIIAIAAFAFCGCGQTRYTPEPEIEVEEEPAEETEVSEESEDTTEAEDEAEAADSGIVTDGDFDSTWQVIQENGFNESGYSNLSFGFLDEPTETDDYYEIKVALYKGIKVPASLAVGDTVTFDITTSDLQTTVYNVTKTDDNNYSSEDGMEFYSFEDADTDDMITLYCDSDDRVDTVFYEGTVRISKEANVGIDLTNEYWTIKDTDMVDEFGDFKWYNGVKFDDNGIITDLISFGD